LTWRPSTPASTDGLRIYQRSLTFLVMVTAMHELFANMRLRVDHSVTLGGFLLPGCWAASAFGPEPSYRPSSRAHAPDHRRRRADRAAERMSTAEARRLFAEQGYDDKVRLLAYREEEQISRLPAAWRAATITTATCCPAPACSTALSCSPMGPA
jgi:hypothetical protein